MLRVCSRCGKIHDKYKKCYVGVERKGDHIKLRDTYSWELKSKQIRDRANYLCEVCRDKGQLTYDDLEVHHIETIKDRPDLYLEDSNLICLCREHHKQAENGELDKEYLIDLALRREGI